MAAKEVVTIQCGNFSNFVGTHWWNLQVGRGERERLGEHSVAFSGRAVSPARLVHFIMGHITTCTSPCMSRDMSAAIRILL